MRPQRSLPRGICWIGANIVDKRHTSRTWIHAGAMAGVLVSPQSRRLRSCGWLAVLSLVFAQREFVTASILIPSAGSTTTCNAATEYYDTSVLGCNRCIGPTGGATSPNSLLIPDSQHLDTLGLASTCTCRNNAYLVRNDDSYCASTWPAPCNLDVCSKCADDMVPSADGTVCMSCGSSTLGIDSSTNECKCAANAILLEKNTTGEYLDAKECVACSTGTYSDATKSACVACSDPAMTLVSASDGSGDLRCGCKTGYQLVTSKVFNQSTCVAQTRTAILNAKVSMSLASTVTFTDFSASETGSSGSAVSFASDLLNDIFPLAATECYFYRSEKQTLYCQALGNLCVLQHLRPDAAPCALLDLIQKSGRVTSANGVNGWYYTLPFLTYKSNSAAVLESKAIGMTMSFDESANSGTHDHIDFKLAVYSINGTLKAFRPLKHQFLYCLDASATASSSTPLWTRFGVSTSSQFTCDLSSLTVESMELYELFLVDKSKSEGTDGRYVSVPVKNLNYADSRGLYINQNQRSSDSQDDVLSHRFFLFDVASGVQVGETKTRVYRYATSITVTMNTQDNDLSTIFPPLLTLAYTDTQTIATAAPVKFQVIYASNTSRFWSAAVTLFVIACVLAGARVLLHMFTWQRRNTRNEEMALTAWSSFTVLLTSLVANAARACFVVLFLLCVYFLLFFKLQSSVFLLLPKLDAQLERARKDEYYAFRVVLPLAFSFQLVSVFHRVYLQTQVQLVLIDWEKPRAKVIDVDSSKVQPAPVSVWRTILVANEWNKLQTVRRTSLRFTIVMMLFLLYGCDVRSLSLPIPRAQMSYLSTKATTASTLTTDQDLAMNLYLRFATVSSLWLLLCLAQRLWKWLIYERFISEPREQLFIDLCTIVKVSCFIVDETYHGFYLHCRSPYPFADGSMSEIVEQLKQEAAGLTVGRGLDSSYPDCQTFEMFFTRKWKRKYLTLYNAVHNTGMATKRDEGSPTKPLSPLRGAGAGRVRAGMSPWHAQSASSFLQGWGSSGSVATQSMVQASTELSDFLKSFVDNLDEQFRWRIYRMETCLSRFFGIPPEMSATRQAYFLPDSNLRFTRVLSLGAESDLMLMNILCFCAFDLWFSNHAISAFATYLLESLLMRMRAHFGSKNVARNSLVDPRFLI